MVVIMNISEMIIIIAIIAGVSMNRILEYLIDVLFDR